MAILGAAAALAPPAARGETLAEAMAAAYRDNPTLEAERAALRATDEEVPEALSGWRPTIEFDASAGLENIDSQSEEGLGAQETLTPQRYELSVVQPLYRGGRTVADTERAENQVLADRARLAEVEQDVLLQVATVYMDVLRDHAVLELAVNNEQRLRRQLEATRDRFEVGEVTRTDVAQAESRVSTAVAERIRAEGDLVRARAAYLNVVGRLPRSLVRPDSLTETPPSERAAREIATQEHPTIRRAIFAERAARNEIAVAKGVLLPELQLRGSYTRTEDTSTFIESQNTGELLAELAVPLYQSGAEHAQVRAAREVASQRRIEIEEGRRSVLENVTRAWEDLQTARARISAFRDAVRAAEIALEGVEQEAAVGSRTTLDVLDAEQELFDARVDLVRAERDELVASYALQAAIGRLTADQLGLPVDLYDVRRHYDSVRDKIFGTSIDAD